MDKASQYQAGYVSFHRGQKCQGCENFRPPSGCTKVKGTIHPEGWCAIYYEPLKKSGKKGG